MAVIKTEAVGARIARPFLAAQVCGPSRTPVPTVGWASEKKKAASLFLEAKCPTQRECRAERAQARAIDYVAAQERWPPLRVLCRVPTASRRSPVPQKTGSVCIFSVLGLHFFVFFDEGRICLDKEGAVG